MSKDSRRAPRAKILSLTVRYKSATVAEFVENHSYDVSRGGIFIKTNAPFPTGTLIKFEVRIAEEQRLMTGVGRVTWRREQDSGPDAPAGMGVKFIKIDSESVDVIDRLIAAREHAASSFEKGAAAQGIRLSDPPSPLVGSANERSSSRPPPSGDMLEQSSELLKSAVGSLRPGQVPSDQRVALPSGDDIEESDLFKSVSVSSRPNAVEPTPVSAKPTSSGAPAPSKDAASTEASTPSSVTQSSVAQSSAAQSSAAQSSESEDGDADDGDEDEFEEDDEQSATPSQPASKRPSNRPKGKKGKKGKKKKKRKFKYANIPSPRPMSKPASSAELAPISSVTTTPPTRRGGEANQSDAPKSNKLGLIAVLVVLVLGGVYWFTRGSSGEGARKPAAEPVKAAAPSSEQPSAPKVEPAPAASSDSAPSDSAPSNAAADPSAPAGAAELAAEAARADDANAADVAAASATASADADAQSETAAPKKRARRWVPKKRNAPEPSDVQPGEPQPTAGTTGAESSPAPAAPSPAAPAAPSPAAPAAPSPAAPSPAAPAPAVPDRGATPVPAAPPAASSAAPNTSPSPAVPATP